MRQPGGFFYWVKVIIILAGIGAGFFCGQKVWASQNILINEVMYDLKGADDKHEWIEIYNSGSEAVDLTGWKFNDGDGATNHAFNLPPENGSRGSMIIPADGFALLAGNAETLISDLPNYSGTIIDTVMSLNNTSAQLKLLNAEGIEIAAVSYNKSSGANGNGKTLEWDGNIFKESLSEAGTPGAVNSVVTAPTSPPAEQPATPPASEPVQNNTASSTTPLYQGGIKIKLGDVVINELVSDPADNEVEWLELFNRTGQEIDLTGWRLEDGSGAKTNLSGILVKYKIIEKPVGNLNNDGDLVVLYDATGRIIDQVAYGNWPDGSIDDNAPVAPDPGSLARKFDGYNSYNNFNDFAATIKPTKGGGNIIQAEDEVSAEAKAKFDFSNDIYLTEILPNPSGDDTKLEFIEIYNAGKRAVDLTGWSLSNEDGKKINLEKFATSTKIQAGEYLVFFRPKTKIVLHNDQGEVRLFQPLADKPLRAVKYKDVKEGWSYAEAGGDWIWSEAPTPGAVNIIETINHAPEVSFSFKSPVLVNSPVSFDSSDTADAEGDKLKFAWDFGDGFKNNLANPEHTYLKIGMYKVKLEVSDGQETKELVKSIKAVDSLSSEQPEIASSPEAPRNDSLIINEIMPNPQGADTGGEWLELVNQTENKINLAGWRIENSNGKYKFAKDLWLEAGNFYILNNAVSKLAFKNSADIISLYNNLNELVDKAEYSGAVENEAYARGENDKWFWTTELTPGEENVISLADSQISKEYKVSSIKGNAEYLEATLEKVRELEIGNLVKVKGVVAVEPGILGAQIFYIVGSPGIQVYNYKKDFPALKVGDEVQISGELAQAQGELRLKTKEKNDIKIAGHKAPPQALALSCDAANEENVGNLIVVTGEITDKKSSTIYLDDGNDEILVYLKKAAGIETKTLTAGQKVAVTGILSKTQTGLRLLPRSDDDIVRLASAGGNEPQVLGEVVGADEWALAARDKKMELFKYLLIIAGAVIAVLAGLYIKVKRKN